MMRTRSTMAAIVVAVVSLVAGGVAYASSLQFRTELRGDQEVPLRVTGAEGEARLQLRENGTVLRYRLNVKGVDNLWMAHIHLAPEGTNGPIVVWLLPAAGPPPASSVPGTSKGRVAEGEITADDLVGPLAGRTLDDLLDQIAAGNAYVNVHTNDFVDPPNTGPGDFPGGEIRGQLHEH